MTQAPAGMAAAHPIGPVRRDAGDYLPLLLGLIGLACGLAIHELIPGPMEDAQRWRAPVIALMAAIGLGSALLLRSDRDGDGRAPMLSVLAVLTGATLYGLSAWTAARQSVGGVFGDGNVWPVLAMTAALMIAVPHLARWIAERGAIGDRLGLSAPSEVIRPFWIAVAMVGVGILFMLASQLLLLLVAFLLDSLGVQNAYKWIYDSPAQIMVAFGALGLAIGTMRRRPRMTDTFLRLAGTILGLLTPVAMVIVAGFLILLVIQLASGAVTTVSVGNAALAAGLVSAILLNAVYADPDTLPDTPGAADADARPPVAGWRRWPSMVLAASILPLGLVAAIALGVRIADYGLTHERLWGIVAAVLAIAYGIACWLAVKAGPARFEPVLGHHQGRWMAGAAVVLAVMALQPIDFGRVAVADQLARLADGRTKPGAFDIEALDRDMGDDGRAAVATLTKRTDTVGADARRVVADRRYQDVQGPAGAEERAALIRENILKSPSDLMIDGSLLAALDDTVCARQPCQLVRYGSDEIVVVPQGLTPYEVKRLVRTGKNWSSVKRAEVTRAVNPLTRDSAVTLRDATRRELVVDGKPTGIIVD